MLRAENSFILPGVLMLRTARANYSLSLSQSREGNLQSEQRHMETVMDDKEQCMQVYVHPTSGVNKNMWVLVGSMCAGRGKNYKQELICCQ